MRSEKEKMLSGQIYDANYDNELLLERESCKERCFDYNATRPANKQKRKDIIEIILGKYGSNTLIEQPFYCDYGYNIEVGDNFYSNFNLVILDEAKVTFGDNVFVGPNCSFYTAGHPLNITDRNKGLEYARPITIGSNVWFGGGVTVLPGVSIGNNTTIGAGSVVVKNIPDNAVAIGNPCHVVRYLLDE